MTQAGKLVVPWYIAGASTRIVCTGGVQGGQPRLVENMVVAVELGDESAMH